MMTSEEKSLIGRAGEWIDARAGDLVEDIKKLVSIKSVNRRDEVVKPYGQGCHDVVDAVMSLCAGYGFDARNHEYYCCSALLPGKTAEQIGIFAHLDVVPEGNDWSADPYTPYVKDGFIIGRGTADNKGSVVTSLYVLRCLRDLGLPLKHSVMLFMGCAEEAGMDDVAYFLARNPAPKFSYTPDAAYSVCYGEKGVLQAQFSRDLAGGNLLSFKGGQITNAVADRASALLCGVGLERAKEALAAYKNISAGAEGDLVRVNATGIAAHAAFAEESVNAIGILALALAEQRLVQGPALEAMNFIASAFADIYGTGLDIAFEDDISGKTSCIGGMAFMEGTVFTQDINVRYAIRTDVEDLRKRLEARCAEHGFKLSFFHDSKPAYTPPDSPVIGVLNDCVAEFYGDRFSPYIMGGGTYARKIPNAVGLGPGTREKTPFGGGHQPDEGVNIQNLLTAARVYILALLRLDGIL
jgi:succinyl-diaminopimelate desuccinylase